MLESREADRLRRTVALLRITVGVIILVTWWDNFQKGVYTSEGIVGLFNYIFNDTGGGTLFGYRSIINNTILQYPAVFAAFQMVAELAMGLGLVVGALTPIAGLAATFFFFNLFLAFYGGTEWIWTYVLLTVSAFVVAWTRSGRALGFDAGLVRRRGKPPWPFLW